MAVISDIAGTSNESFSINGRSLDKGVTLYQGDVEPDRLVGNDGDVYFKKEGLIYIKRNGVWLSHGLNLDVRDQYESLKWLPDPRSYNKFLIYSNGDNYTIANNLKFNENGDNCLRLESSLPNNADSKYVPNIEWVNDRIIHKRLTQEIGDNIENTYNENYEDKVGNIVAYQNVKINDPNNSSKMTFSTKSKNNTEAKIELIAEDNNTYATAPTPSDDAEDNKIVTAEWTKNILNIIINNFNNEINNINIELNNRKLIYGENWIEDPISQTLIQWGESLQNNNTNISFPKPFTQNPSIVGTCNYSGITENGHGYIYDVTTTTFKHSGVDGDMKPFRWIAIGR